MSAPLPSMTLVLMIEDERHDIFVTHGAAIRQLIDTTPDGKPLPADRGPIAQASRNLDRARETQS